MKLNMGTLDRRLRLFLITPGLVIAGLVIGPGGLVPIGMYVLAGVMMATSLVGTCPLYLPFGIRTFPHHTAGVRTAAKS